MLECERVLNAVEQYNKTKTVCESIKNDYRSIGLKERPILETIDFKKVIKKETRLRNKLIKNRMKG